MPPIFAVVKAPKGQKRYHVTCGFIFRTQVQSKIENAMTVLGHSVRNYYLTRERPDDALLRKVKLLDADGFALEVK
jgi:hypothetical protein